jgi:RHS repeat-associated protein
LTHVVRYVYDEQSRLIGEYDSVTGYSQETVWFNSQPVATVINGTIYYVNADNIGAPRFPGQVATTGVPYYQNGARDYSPVTGRYIQPDPTGLTGGLSRYAYAGGNPLNRVDPTGLLNFVGGVGGGVVLGGSGGEAAAGGYYNVDTGQKGGFTSSGGGLNWMTSGQSGLYAGGGSFAGFVTGDISSVAGGFINWNLAIPGTNFGLTIYFNSDGGWVGGAISYGPGIGADRTTTNTILYPYKPCQ